MKKHNHFLGFGRKWISVPAILICAIFCLLAISCQPPGDDSVSQDDLKDQTIEKAFEDYKKVICEKDTEALRRLCPRRPNMSSEEYERALETILPDMVMNHHGEGYAEWLKDAYIVRKEYFGDGKGVILWLGPETQKKEFEHAEKPAWREGEEPPESITHYIQFHQKPLRLQRHKGGWILYL